MREYRMRIIIALRCIQTKMGSFWDDLGDGIQMPFKWAYGKFDKVDHASDKIMDAGTNAAGGLADLLSGNSNILVYAGVALVAVIVLPKVLDKVL
jgi:hypothetical protein